MSDQDPDPCPECGADPRIAHRHGKCGECGNVMRLTPERAEAEFQRNYAGDPSALADDRVSVCTTCYDGFWRWQRASESEKEAVHEQEMVALEIRRIANGWHTEPVLVQCPRCRAEQEDHDGFGVLHCDACGYCVHPSITGSSCDACGARTRTN